MNLKTTTALSLLLTGSLVACGAPEPEQAILEAPDASFSIGKADGPAGGFTSCQLREVLKVINESETTFEALRDEVKVHTRAAKNIYAHRIGPDALPGTGDDDLFDDLKELDDVSHVGPVALKQLVDFIKPRCAVDLDRPYIDSETWTGFTGGGWTRDSFEIEATRTITGTTGSSLRAVIQSDDERGRWVFNRVARGKAMEAFSYDYPLDEIPWKRSAHRAREAMPYVSLSIEGGRFDIDEDDGDRELSLGTDYNDDTYYDTLDYDLLSVGAQLRGRIRYDNDDSVRRLLIAAKFNALVDDEGLKRAGKIDVRTEGGAHLKTLDDDVRAGTVPWSGRSTPIEPIKAVYDSLQSSNRLKELGNFKGLLLLDPKAHVRSVRSRYHLDETQMDSLLKVYNNGLERLQEAHDLAQSAVEADTIPAGDLDAVKAFIDASALALSGDAIKQHAAPRLAALDPTSSDDDVVLPQDFTRTAIPDSFLALEQRQIVAESADLVLHDLAEMIDDLDRVIAGSQGLPGEDYADMFIAWQQVGEPALRAKTIAKPFLQRWQAIEDLNDPQARADAIAAFNAFGLAQRDAGDDDFEDFEALDEALWANLGKHLRRETLKYGHRMIEAGGTAAQSIWFDLARRFYVPSSSRVTWNFMIDTMDYAEMVTPEEWQRIPEDERTPSVLVPGDKVFHSTLVNEVQLELTEVQDYIDRIESLKKTLDNGEGDADTQRMLDGARFVFKRYQAALTIIADLKGDDVVDVLEDNGILGDVQWVPATHSKGQTALLILTDKL